MREVLKSVFDNDYQGYPVFIDNVLRPIFGEDMEVLPVKEKLDIDSGILQKASIKELCRVATIDRMGVDTIEVFDVTLDDKTVISRSRVGIQRIIRSAIFQYTHAFMLFHYENPEGRNWRFSYAYKQDKNSTTTEAKRYTYLFGQNLHCRTAIDRFAVLAKSSKDNKALLDAFSVEALSDEFFDTYRKQYAKFVKYITGKEFVKEGGKWVEKQTGIPNDVIFNAFSREDKRVRDYIKKMMGRITFLHFLQRKRWMNEDLNFMLHLFQNSDKQDNYLEAVLEPLFFGILNTKSEDRAALFAARGWNVGLLKEWENIPYLNGGLFEEDEEDNVSVTFPKEYFAELFAFYAEYNFTVDENDPDDAEVGVDPEMLGKIFENLLEDNKDKGAFYTPKEIVRYMCQESLIAYLVGKSGIEEQKIRDFVMLPYDTVGNFEDKELEDLLKYLDEVKICDPAIGSGAFPMGLLNELVRCEEAIVLGQEKNTARAELKKSIIKNNIYGVDIEKGAVDIARLRFWLSLVVDEDKPMPLPNLDYKIMQGNSLLESYNGVDLSHLLEPDETDLFSSTVIPIQMQLESRIDEYYTCGDHRRKLELKEEIKDLIVQLPKDKGIKEIDLSGIDVTGNTHFFLWHTWFSDVFKRPSDCNGNSGFDIVIGNPPYLEARSSEFSEELKSSIQYEIKQKRPDAIKLFPRGADLLIYFYELSLRLLAPNGYNVFITENAWLSTDYGKDFQTFLQDKCLVHAVIDSDYKYFDSADINTVITFFKNKPENSEATTIRFFHCLGSLEKYPCNTFSSISTENVVLKEVKANSSIIKDNKWGFVFSADERVLDMLNVLYEKQDATLSTKISIGQGLNITKSHILMLPSESSVPYYTSENGATYSWEQADTYVPATIASASRKRPKLILPRGLGTHFCSVNNCSGFTASYVEIYGNLSDDEIMKIWLFCNSSLLWLLRELTGRTNLGGGMLKAEATDLKAIPICYDFDIEKIKPLYLKLKGVKISTNLSETLADPYHLAIDNLVLSSLGLTDYSDFIINSLIDRVLYRTRKSRTK